jgi:hypothetical protein
MVLGEHMIQIVSIIGSLLILAAYTGNQIRWIGPSNLSYALLNFIGSVILGAVAVIEQQWGFLLLEGVWSLVSLAAFVKLVRLK